MAHEAYYNTEGKEIPSVTQILKILNKKGLMEWSNYLGMRRIKYKEFLDEKALLGTLVHKRIECDINHTEYEPFIDTGLEMEVERRFNQYLQWKTDYNVDANHSELRLTNENYGGTIDFIGVVGGLLTIGDFKTSKKPQFTHVMQLGGYLNLIQHNDENLYNSIQSAKVICFPEHKSYVEITLSKDDMLEYQIAFNKLYDVFNTLNTISISSWNESLI